MNRSTKVLTVITVLLLLVIGYMAIDNASTTNDARAIVYVNDIGTLNAGGTLDHLCSAWCGRIYAFGVLLLGFSVVYGYYSYRLAIIDAQVDIASYEADAKVAQTQTLVKEPDKPDVRIIPFNTRTSVNSGSDIKLNETLTLPKSKLIEFISKSLDKDGPGLAIGRWKKEGWDQVLVEGLLDYLSSIDIVTPRSNGRVCEYTGDYDLPDILRKISIGQ